MTREPLPNRRPCRTFGFQHDGHRFTSTVGLFADGRPAEVFMSAGKPGAALETACRDAAVAVSIALQHGAPVEVLRHAVTTAAPLGRWASCWTSLRRPDGAHAIAVASYRRSARRSARTRALKPIRRISGSGD